MMIRHARRICRGGRSAKHPANNCPGLTFVTPVHVPVRMISPLLSWSPRLRNALLSHMSAFRGCPRTIAPVPLATVTPSSIARTGRWRGLDLPIGDWFAPDDSNIESKISDGTYFSRGTSATTRRPTISSATKHSAMTDRNAAVSENSADIAQSRSMRNPNSHSMPRSPAGIRYVVRSPARARAGSAHELVLGTSIAAAPRCSLRQSCGHKFRRPAH